MLQEGDDGEMSTGFRGGAQVKNHGGEDEEDIRHTEHYSSCRDDGSGTGGRSRADESGV